MWPIFQRWTISPRVAQFARCDPFFQLWLVLPSMSPFFKCDPYSHNVTHFSRGDIFVKWHIFRCCGCFPIVTLFLCVAHFSKCNLLLQVSPIFFQTWPVSVTLSSSEACFFNCEPFHQMCSTFSCVTSSSTRGLYSKTWLIFPSVTHFSKFDSFFFFTSVTHF